MPLAVTLAQLATASGYRRDDPLVIAIGRTGRRPVPARGVDLVVLALGDRTERRIELTDRLLRFLLAAHPTRPR